MQQKLYVALIASVNSEGPTNSLAIGYFLQRKGVWFQTIMLTANDLLTRKNGRRELTTEFAQRQFFS